MEPCQPLLDLKLLLPGRCLGNPEALHDPFLVQSIGFVLKEICVDRFFSFAFEVLGDLLQAGEDLHAVLDALALVHDVFCPGLAQSWWVVGRLRHHLPVLDGPVRVVVVPPGAVRAVPAELRVELRVGGADTPGLLHQQTRP